MERTRIFRYRTPDNIVRKMVLKHLKLTEKSVKFQNGNSYHQPHKFKGIIISKANRINIWKKQKTMKMHLSTWKPNVLNHV